MKSGKLTEKNCHVQKDGLLISLHTHLFLACMEYFLFFLNTFVIIPPVLTAVFERTRQLLLVLPAL